MASLGSSELWPRDMPGWGTADWIPGDFPRGAGVSSHDNILSLSIVSFIRSQHEHRSRCSWLFCDHWKPLAYPGRHSNALFCKTQKQLAEKWIFRPPWRPLRLCGAGQLTWLIAQWCVGSSCWWGLGTRRSGLGPCRSRCTATGLSLGSLEGTSDACKGGWAEGSCLAGCLGEAHPPTHPSTHLLAMQPGLHIMCRVQCQMSVQGPLFKMY